MTTAAIITALYNRYDTLKELRAQSLVTDAICITDDPDLTSETWDVRYEPRPGVHPNVAAKAPKCCPWRYTDADIVIWLDGSFLVQSSDFVEAMCAYLPLGQFVHPDRDCIYTEADYSSRMQKYGDLDLNAQTDHYRAAGHPDGWGLWATGLIVRRRTPAIERCGQQWLAEIERWGYQDQVSQPFVLRECGLRPATVPGQYFSNPWVQYAGSAQH